LPYDCCINRNRILFKALIPSSDAARTGSGLFYYLIMAKDPAFLFYPGDYLRDTQTLSENVQVAYDRIMCEHMRNICISQQQLKFFTKKLTDDEKAELMFVLTEIEGGYQIEWVAESIEKRRKYSESRRNNRKGKTKKHIKNISKTYDKHMEDEDVIEDVNTNRDKTESKKPAKKDVVYPFDTEKFKRYWGLWLDYKSKEFNFKYKSEQSEQAALKKLANYSQNNESKAIQIIEESMANGWKGFFEIKNGKNGNKESSTERAARYFNSQTDDVFADYPGN